MTDDLLDLVVRSAQSGDRQIFRDAWDLREAASGRARPTVPAGALEVQRVLDRDEIRAALA